ncbi:MAG: ATP-binding protein [Steroidobacteraceae bacterium]
MRSIRFRLLFGLLGSMLIVQILIYLLIYARVEDEIDDLFDGELERSAIAVSTGAAPLPVLPPRRNVEYPQEGMVISIWADSRTGSPVQSARLEGLPRATPLGFSKIVIDNRQWRLFGARSGDRLVVAAQPADVRNVAARRITLRILMPSLAVVPITGLMILLAVAFGLRPLMRVTADLRSRSHRDLSPIATNRLPPDIAPVAYALNELMLRLGNIIAAQRNFIADAAHELLTPLTALRLQAQLLARAESPNRQREALSELQGGVSRTLQLARQLLTLARHGADAEDQTTAQVDLEAIVRNVAEIHRPMAQAKSIRMEISAQSPCTILGCEEALNTMVSSVIENAIKYSDIDGVVRVGLQAAPTGIVLDIEDSGPGIPAAERERVFDRFYRRTAGGASGSGLGLAIAREIATRHGASITLKSSKSLGGLCACIRFERAGAAGQLDKPLPRVA